MRPVRSSGPREDCGVMIDLGICNGISESEKGHLNFILSLSHNLECFS